MPRLARLTHSALTLNLILPFLLAAAFIALAVPLAFAQVTNTPAPPSTHSFDVATIKPNAPDGRPGHGWIGFQTKPDGMEFASQSLPDLLCYAYGYKTLRFDGQISGLPDWALKQRYDIVAKFSAADMPA